MHLLSGLARIRRALTVPLPLVGLLAAAGPLALSAGSTAAATDPGEVAYRSLPALPAGSDDAGLDGVVQTALGLARALNAVPVDAAGTACAEGDLVVSWAEPGPGYERGAFVSPVGPEPTAATTDVNGVVLCEGRAFAFMGFEASFAGGRWDVVAVPDVSDESEEHLVEEAPVAIPQGPKPVPVLAAPGTVTGPIEGYAAYEPQRTCDASPKVGMRSLAGALLRDYPGSRNLGIVRGCSVGGRSEHKEGRAFDWGVLITNPNEKAAAQSFISSLMATDGAGHEHALARRMGVMYLIFDRQIWSSYRASEGWRPYTGASAHRDHVHISMSWAGALGRTSFWSGTVPPDLPTASPNTSTVASRRSGGGGGGSGSIAATHDGGGGGERRWRDRERDHAATGVRLSRDELRAGADQLWQDGTPPTEAEIAAWLAGLGVSGERVEKYASWAAERARRQADEAARREERAAEHEADETRERERREASREERRRREAAREERKAEETQRREEAREARREREEAEQAARRERREAWEAAERERREAKEEAARERREAKEAEQQRREAEEQARRDRRAAWEAERARREAERRAAWEARRASTTTTAAPAAPTTVPPTTVPPTTAPPTTAPPTTEPPVETTTTSAPAETTTTTATG